MTLANEILETQKLTRQAWELGVEMPTGGRMWDDDSEELMNQGGMSIAELELQTSVWLSEEGKARLRFAISEARTKLEDARLERLQRRISIYAQIITLILSLGGIAIGIISALRR